MASPQRQRLLLKSHHLKSMAAPYITPEGYTRMLTEVDHLVNIRRPEVTRAVSEAAAMGDRSENAEYIYGKKLLRELDRRIRFLQKRLPELQVVHGQPVQVNKVYFGAYVELEDLQANIQQVRIVGSDEFDPAQRFISVQSPLARALLGKQLNDEVQVQLPNGERALYTIINIRYTKTSD